MDLRFPNTRDRAIEIRDVIHGSIVLKEWEKKIIDSPFFQRLRNIRQLGFSEFAYPGATHNRYTHSIGAMHLAGMAFQQIFQKDTFSSLAVYYNYLNVVRAAALLHDIGHGPLSHTIEFAMPEVAKLKLPLQLIQSHGNRQATHEDYTLKIVLDSSLTEVIQKNYSPLEITEKHIASIISLDHPEEDDFFIDKNVNYRKILHQIVSSEIDADRMDYLQRDSYYTGVSYGKYDLEWLLSNLTYYISSDENDPRNFGTAHLALSNRAIYTFEDFLLSRYHMFLMVYYHHKSIVYEQMLEQYLRSKDCSFRIPADIEAYVEFDDNYLWQHLRLQKNNQWAKRISEHQPYHLAYEIYNRADSMLPELKKNLVRRGIPFLETTNLGLVSKYIGGSEEFKKNNEIFVLVTDRVSAEKFVPLESFTELFRRYEKDKEIIRLYTPEKIDHWELG